MDKKYMLFLKREELDFLRESLQSALEYAKRRGDAELLMLVMSLVYQANNARELKPKRKGWGGALKDQLLG
jgi:hypothetical protein